jgi:hypothetical protein
MISSYSRFSRTMTAIRDAGPATVAEDEVAVDDAGLGPDAAEDRVVVEPPPHPATAISSSATVTIHVTP